jgi:hypothetical protein
MTKERHDTTILSSAIGWRWECTCGVISGRWFESHEYARASARRHVRRFSGAGRKGGAIDQAIRAEAKSKTRNK